MGSAILEKRRFLTPVKLKAHPSLISFGLMINAGATGFQAKEIKGNISEKKVKDSIPFSVSGNIDRYKWNNANVRYMGSLYKQAFINNSNKIIANSKWNFWSVPKIVVAGMTKKIEAVYVETPLALGVGVYGIYDFKSFNPIALTAVLNSLYLTYYFTNKFKDKHLAGGYLAINKSTIENFPLVNISEPYSGYLIQLHNKIQYLLSTNLDSTYYENKIDALVFHLYDLNEVEMNQVLDSFQTLDTKDRTQIQNEYRNITNNKFRLEI